MQKDSLTPQESRLKALKEILPEVFAEGKIDFEKLKATLGEDVNFSNERYVLNWAGKSEAFKVMQTPSSKTLVPAPEESLNFNETNNIFIEGENLEVLKILQRSYFGKVKMIYIDPPYNTGNDSFIYPDKFSEKLADYQERIGDKDEDGYLTKDGFFRKNSKENGQYHSNWLNMMMPRLYLAKSLLRQDGVIFVSIDDNEVHNLRLLMNEIFGEENFVGQIIRQTRKGGGSMSKHISSDHDYIICFAKNKDSLSKLYLEYDNEYLKRYKEEDGEGKFFWDTYARNRQGSANVYTITFPDGAKITKGWINPENVFKKLLQDGEVRVKKINDCWSVQVKQRINLDGAIFRSLILDSTNEFGTKDIKDLIDGTEIFSYAKPVKLIKKLIKTCTKHNDLILDFFAGSATTAHAVMELNKEDGGNRKYICVQLPELCSEAFKAGYKTIAEIGKERIRRASKKIAKEIADKEQNQENQLQLEEKTENKIDLGFKVLKLADSNFKQWQSDLGKDADELARQTELFIDPIATNATNLNMVYEFLLKNGKDLNSKIALEDCAYSINDNELILILEETSEEIIAKAIAKEPQKIIALDRLFKGNDQLKTNVVLQMKDAEIDFKTF